MTETIQYRFLCRRGTAAALEAANEVPLQGEIIKEIDTGREKTGDGITHYNDLAYTIVGFYRIDTTTNGLADGDAMIWDASLGLFVPGNAKSDISLGTPVSTPDATGTIIPPADITNWIKVQIEGVYYLIPAYKYLGEEVITSLPDYIHALSPVAYWQLQESSGTNLVDDVAGEILTLSGSYALQQSGLVVGDSRKSIQFSGGSANGSASSKWSLGGGDCSGTIIASWSTNSLAAIATIRDSGPSNILALLNVNRVQVGDANFENWAFNSVKANSSRTNLDDGAPHALGFNFFNSSKTMELYVDGVLEASVVCTGSRPNSTTMFVGLATNVGFQNLPGNLQDFALYSKVLTEQQHLDISNIVLNGHT